MPTKEVFVLSLFEVGSKLYEKYWWFNDDNNWIKNSWFLKINLYFIPLDFLLLFSSENLKKKKN